MPSISVPEKSLFSCKISLKYSKPPVWRRVHLPTDYTFGDLHAVIMEVMEWDNTHLHMFHFKDQETGQKTEIKGPGVQDFDEFKDAYFIPESSKIAPYVKRLKLNIHYEYDFGCGWEHLIEIEKIIDASCDVKYPKCIGGKNMPPPEDDPDGVRSEAFDVKRIDTNLSRCKQFLKESNAKDTVSGKHSSATSADQSTTVSGESNEPPAKKKRTGKHSASK